MTPIKGRYVFESIQLLPYQNFLAYKDTLLELIEQNLNNQAFMGVNPSALSEEFEMLMCLKS